MTDDARSCTFTCEARHHLVIIVVSTGTPGWMLGTMSCGEWVLPATGNNECMGPNGEPCFGGAAAYNRVVPGQGTCILHSGYQGACGAYPETTVVEDVLDLLLAELEQATWSGSAVMPAGQE